MQQIYQIIKLLQCHLLFCYSKVAVAGVESLLTSLEVKKQTIYVRRDQQS